MSTIRPVDPATIRPPQNVAPDPLAPPPSAAPAAHVPPAKRIAMPELPKIRAAFAESQGGDVIVTVPLPGGGDAKMRAPKVALQLFVGQCIGNDFSPYLWNLCKAVMYVEEVNGSKVERPRDRIELQKIMNKLGDVGVELVMAAYRDFFGVMVEADQLPLSDPQ